MLYHIEMTTGNNIVKKDKDKIIMNRHYYYNYIDLKNVNPRLRTDHSYTHKVIWKLLFGAIILHLMALWGLSVVFIGGIGYKTFIWTLLLVILSTEGITIGAHRLYSHKSFKAKPLLKAILILCQTISGEKSLYTWCLYHRLHHRYADTDSDPHNSKRGFFFAHIGWLMCEENPHVIDSKNDINMSDLEADWMAMFQYKYYYYLYFVIGFLIPVAIPCLFLGETFMNSILVCFALRYLLHLHTIFLINRAAHMYGTRPYDKTIQVVENRFASFVSFGEGWHNYHHTFPWDYKAAELSMDFNQSASLIRFFEKLGLAYDLKTLPQEMISRRIVKSGDGTHDSFGNK